MILDGHDELLLFRGDAEFDMGGFFEPYVLQWLVDTDNKTTQWVQAAIAADKARLGLSVSKRIF